MALKLIYPSCFKVVLKSNGETEMLIKYGCTNEFQDRVYGKGIRVANEVTKQSSGSKVGRCTVCRKEAKEHK